MIGTNIYNPQLGDLLAWFEIDDEPPTLGMIVDIERDPKQIQQTMYIVEWYGISDQLSNKFEHPLRDIKKFRESYNMLRKHDNL